MNFSEIINQFRFLKVTVIGDAMLDQYVIGSATRISPEAPVMVIDEHDSFSVPGGAANVAINVRSLGASCKFIGVVGDDLNAASLAKSLEDNGISSDGLIKDSSRPTTLKTRIVANHSHQVLRIDREERKPVSEAIQLKLLQKVEDCLPEADLIMMSDYAKGCLNEYAVQEIIHWANSREIPVVANPKPSTANWYRGAALLSLNMFEAARATNQENINSSNVLPTAAKLRNDLQTKGIVITMRENGMAGSWPEQEAIVPAILVAVYDEAGAGDTAISTLALATASGADGKTAMELAVRTAAIVVTKVGVASISQEELVKIAAERVS